MRIPTCHPDRKHWGHGLCRKCHRKEWGVKKASKLNRKGNGLQKYWPGSTWQEALDNYYDMVNAQGGYCAAGCGTHNNDIERGLRVDHCHTAGKVRGLLCMPCNVAEGLTTIEALKGLISYKQRAA